MVLISWPYLIVKDNEHAEGSEAAKILVELRMGGLREHYKWQNRHESK
jgi:hypothetical protein